MIEDYDDRYNKSESATRFIKQRVQDISPTLDSDDNSPHRTRLKPALWTSILAGGLAGVTVDLSLYPLDTIKTRLQSKEGFKSSGGFKKLYKGIMPVILTSAPLSALFFGTYNTIVNTLRTEDSSLDPFVYLVAASAAELFCAVFRVPLEILKQRKQISNTKSLYIISKTFKEEGFHGFYRGFWSLIMRELPFAAIQYPVWEYMLNQFLIYQSGKDLTALQTAYCGAAAGAVAATMTTPVDVVKTRIMLAEKQKVELYKPFISFNFAKEIYRDRGVFGFFAGIIPRTLWIMLGGFIYFGTYEKAKILGDLKWCYPDGEETFHNISPSYSDEQLERFAVWADIKCYNEEKSENAEATNDKTQTTDFLTKTEKNIVDTTLLEPLNDLEDKKPVD